jgi:hypothetical protein
VVVEKKTLLRTIRITPELEGLLQRDAKLKRISVNALISSIMTKYAEWDRFRERFEGIVITPRGFSAILESVDDEKVERLARELGSALSREFIFRTRELIVLFSTSHNILTCHYQYPD